MAKSTFEQLRKILGPIVVAPRAMLVDDRLTDPERRVLLSLFSFASLESLTVWPSIKSIAERAAIKDHTRISKITNRLQELGWLTKGRKGFSNLVMYNLTVPEYAKSMLVGVSSADEFEAESDAEQGQELPLSKLDSQTNSDGQSNTVPDTNSKLDSDTNSKLDSDTNSKEVSIEVSKEVSTSSGLKPKINGHHKPDPMKITVWPRPDRPPDQPVPAPQNKPRKKPDTGDPTVASPKAVYELYNEILGEALPKAKELTSPRKKHISARIQDNPKRQDIRWWRKYFEVVSASEFLLGHGPPRPNGRPWRADLDWLINETNLTKVIEGKYV